ncbi:hypothetical protein [Sphingobium sp. Ant17]|nr:hypothetical protein [Sphingobium sp. Ant17]|tara:strand:- start:17664 stop:17789 length:126 start_codon:yes stop_codon:yes gene_type:complete
MMRAAFMLHWKSMSAVNLRLLAGTGGLLLVIAAQAALAYGS